MTLEEKIGQKIMLSFRSGWTMKDGTKISSVQNINDEIYEIIGKYDIYKYFVCFQILHLMPLMLN